MSQVSVIATIPPAALLPVVEQALRTGRPLRFLARVQVNPSTADYELFELPDPEDVWYVVSDPEFDVCVGYSTWQPVALHQGLVELRDE